VRDSYGDNSITNIHQGTQGCQYHKDVVGQTQMIIASVGPQQVHLIPLQLAYVTPYSQR
jgi:hypothetical protein